ncbi:MAG: hypothetical protein RBR53_10285 [Desulforegulaceae bacterium]|nr:hypothetical protein [Desulforegulaceae bacterium]
MKKLFKSLSLIFALMGMIFIAGCGDGDDFELIGKKITGAAQDGYLVDSTVFIDLNENNKPDPGEPSAITNMDGKFDLNLSDSDLEFPLVVIGGKDKGSWDTGANDYAEFRGVFQAPAPEVGKKAIISPVTTMIYQYKKDTGKSTKEANDFIAERLGVKGMDLLATDVVADRSEDAQKIYKFNVILASAIKVAADVSEIDFADATQKIALEMAGYDLSNLSNLNTAIENSMEKAFEGKNVTEASKAKELVKNISTGIYKKSDDDLYDEIALVTSYLEAVSDDIKDGIVTVPPVGKTVADIAKDELKKAVKGNADAAGTKLSTPIKGFYLKGNQFNGENVSKSGNCGDITRSSGVLPKVKFELVNSGAGIEQKAEVIVKIESGEDKRYFSLTIPVSLKSESSTVDLKVAKGAKVQVVKGDSEGNLVESELVNEKEDSLTASGEVLIDLEEWYDRFNEKLSTDEKIAVDLDKLTVSGKVKVIFSLKTTPEIVFGYANEDGNITNKFTSVYGNIVFN